MKSKIIIIFSIILLSCKNEKYLNIEKKLPDGTLLYTCLIDTTNGHSDTIQKTEYYPNGNVRVKGTFKNNLKDGEWEYYYENGKLWSKGTFRNGKSEGIFTIYNKDGTLFMKSSYKNGKPDGKWLFYKKNKLIKEVYFSNGEIEREVNY
jgi:antitoxin component YwqK of YwqJK toxin-antitoxin module